MSKTLSLDLLKNHKAKVIEKSLIDDVKKGELKRPNNKEKTAKELKRLNKVINKTDKLLLKASQIEDRTVDGNEDSIVDKKVDINLTRSNNLDLVVLLEEMEPNERRIFIEILKDLESDGSVYKATYVNKNMPVRFKTTNSALKTYLCRWSGDLIEIVNENPYLKKVSKKFRTIKMDSSLKERFDTIVQ